MDNNHKYYHQNCQNQDRKVNKVFINPNYNRSENVTSSNSMHFNPNFSHSVPNLCQHIQQHKDLARKPRIHVNPNFIRNNAYNPVTVHNTEFPTPTILPIRGLTSINHSTCQEQTHETKNPSTSMHVTKSRYCFVRQKEHVIAKSPITKAVTTTVKLNKYKSVSLNVVKHTIATAKHITIDDQFSHGIKNPNSTKPVAMNIHNTRFKFVKSNLVAVSPPAHTKHLAVRRPSLLNKSNSRKKNSKTLMKKNNIPCPLFRKFGKCLRKIQRHCEYLHDKKHVSICHKFLKGICHDANCLLSHDLTDKKMPTCHFYLKGACLKEDCPYLHVKLNEKVKICQDFLKGYCEKGDKCLFRHCSEITSKGKKYPMFANKTSSKMKKKKSQTLYNKQQSGEGLRNKKIYEVNDQPVSAKEQRYFIESIEDKSLDEAFDNIKPSRIKLGTLPSFIQL